MKLQKQALCDKALWEKNGFTLPQCDLDAVAAKTEVSPAWVHFGAGNIFRAFVAALHQDLLNKGLADTGIVVAEGFDYDIIDKAYRPYDNLSLSVVLKVDGTIEKNVIGSVVSSDRKSVV